LDTKYLVIKTYIKILLVFLLFASFSSCETEINKLKTGSIYILKQGNYYTTIKIHTVKRKSISYIPNDYQVSTKKMVYSINKDENYTDNPISLSKKEFKKIKKSLILNTQKK